ncbi:MAG: ferrous iron transport protein A [Armatimonadetes bacterium]|nr:ferrous iron transport protein A [Armatimonadota bacterium]
MDTLDDTERTLASLTPGEQGVVQGLSCEGLTRRRFLDLGLVPGTLVEVALRSPLGDPTAYLIRGSTIALRKDEANKISIRKAV